MWDETVLPACVLPVEKGIYRTGAPASVSPFASNGDQILSTPPKAVAAALYASAGDPKKLSLQPERADLAIRHRRGAQPEMTRTGPPFNLGVNLLFAIALQDRVALAVQDYPSGAGPSGRGCTLLPSTRVTGGLRIT